MKKVEINVYSIEELEEDAKTKAIQSILQEGVYLQDWDEPILQSWIDRLQELGYNGVSIRYSGFWSQGNGAMFEYDSIEDQVMQRVLDSLPQISQEDKQAVLSSYFKCSGKQIGLYYHQNSCDHRLDFDEDVVAFELWEDQIVRKYIEIYRDLCIDLYKDLESYYDELTEHSNVIEYAMMNEYWFKEDGTRFIE